MELDLQRLFGLHVHSCTYWLRPDPPPPAFGAHIRGRYWSANMDDISLWPPAVKNLLLHVFLAVASKEHVTEIVDKTIHFFAVVKNGSTPTTPSRLVLSLANCVLYTVGNASTCPTK
jgi:hypothetical protein